MQHIIHTVHKAKSSINNPGIPINFIKYKLQYLPKLPPNGKNAILLYNDTTPRVIDIAHIESTEINVYEKKCNSLARIILKPITKHHNTNINAPNPIPL